MAKDILAFFGLIFLTLLVLIGVALFALFENSVGIISIPDGLDSFIKTPLSLLTPAPVVVNVDKVDQIGKAEWTNPLDALPEPTITPIPQPTATPVPAMEPAAYRKEVIARMKRFAEALQHWLDQNNKLAQDKTLLQDPTWVRETGASLDEIRLTGKALAGVGPAPADYREVDGWIRRVGPEAAGLSTNFSDAIQSNDSKKFTAAGENFNQIKEDLSQAVNAMLAAGWSIE